MSKLCSIFFYEGYVGVSPTIVNISKELDATEHLVKIYGIENSYPQPGKIGNNTEIVYFKKASDNFLLSKTFSVLRKLKFISLLPVLELINFLFQYFIYIFKNSQEYSKNINIGVDTNGSILALLNYYIFKQKFIYLSLELNPPSNRISKIISILERLAYQKSECIIIQDQDRFETLCEYHKYQHCNVFYLPNSTSSSEGKTQNTGKQNYFREKFKLSEKDFPYIILHAVTKIQKLDSGSVPIPVQLKKPRSKQPIVCSGYLLINSSLT